MSELFAHFHTLSITHGCDKPGKLIVICWAPNSWMRRNFNALSAALQTHKHILSPSTGYNRCGVQRVTASSDSAPFSACEMGGFGECCHGHLFIIPNKLHQACRRAHRVRVVVICAIVRVRPVSGDDGVVAVVVVFVVVVVVLSGFVHTMGYIHSVTGCKIIM